MKESVQLSAEYAARHFLGVSPGRGPPTPQKSESIFSTFFAALNLAVIDTVMGHVNAHIDCHLMSCDASLYVSSGEPILASALQECVEIMATLQHTTARRTHSTTHAHTNINDRHTNTATDTQNKACTSRSMEGRRRRCACPCRRCQSGRLHRPRVPCWRDRKA